MGFVINVLLRFSILYFLLETLFFANDPRFYGKALPMRNLVIVLSLSLVFPLLYFWKRKWKKYPFSLDNLYLSVFFFDMLGNSMNWYDTYFYFDLFPHSFGPGALGIVLLNLLNISSLAAIGLANMLHIGLEAQEYYADIVFHTQNVRGTFDTVNDLLVGIMGTVFYMLIYLKYMRKHHKE